MFFVIAAIIARQVQNDIIGTNSSFIEAIRDLRALLPHSLQLQLA